MRVSFAIASAALALSCCGDVYSASEEAPTQPSTRERVDGLSVEDLARLLPLLREHYVESAKLTDDEVARATVQGLLGRLGAGVRILDAPAAASRTVSAFRSEVISGKTLYLRVGTLSGDNLARCDAALHEHAGTGVAAVVVDLRATPPSNDFQSAARLCERFCPKGKVLFTIRKPNAKREQLFTSREDPRFTGVVVVLVDANTGGAPEVVAAVLRTDAKAMVIGQQTSGEAVEFTDLPLPSGKLLRVATAEVVLPGGTDIFPGGVKPDLPVEVPQETTDAVLAAELEKGVADALAETERPRMNEAALVAGTNPELEALASAQRHKGEKSQTPLRDAVLQRAVDFVTALAVYGAKPPVEK
jgi:C-terminal processing protease CtpA/Prc